MEPDLPNPYAAPKTRNDAQSEADGTNLPAGRYGPYRDNRRLARWLLGLLGLGIFVHATRIAVNLIYSLGTWLDDEVLSARIEAVFGWSQVAAISVMIVFSVWIVRSAKNAWLFAGLDRGTWRRGSSPACPKDTPGWALGWYFIPIASFWRPFGAMRDIVRASTLDAGLPGWLLPTWWTLWLVSLFGDRAARKLGNAAAEWEWLTQLVFWTSVSGIEIALHTVAILLVTGLTRLQSDTARALQDGMTDTTAAAPSGEAR